MIRKSTALASAAALLFAAGAARADRHEGTGTAQKVKCEGVNSCKGQSSCHSEANECAGHNSCSGKGFKMLTPEECEAAKAKLKEDKKDEG
jgi:uncharacterized membrane protein